MAVLVAASAQVEIDVLIVRCDGKETARRDRKQHVGWMDGWVDGRHKQGSEGESMSTRTCGR